MVEESPSKTDRRTFIKNAILASLGGGIAGGTLAIGGGGNPPATIPLDFANAFLKIATNIYHTGLLQAPILSTTILTNDKIWAYPLITGRTYTIDQLAIEVTTPQDWDLAVAIYKDNGSIYPGNQLAIEKHFDLSIVGFQTSSYNVQVLWGTLYWLVLLAQQFVGTAALRAIPPTSLFPFGGRDPSNSAMDTGYSGTFDGGVSNNLPDPFPSNIPIVAGVSMPTLYFRIASSP